jgi:hypothetical protein
MGYKKWIYLPKDKDSRSQWPHLLRRGSVATRVFWLWVPILSRAWLPVSCEYCVLSDRGLGLWSLVQRSLTECGVSECDRKASIMRKPWPARGCWAMKEDTRQEPVEGIQQWITWLLLWISQVSIRVSRTLVKANLIVFIPCNILTFNHIHQ